MISIPRSLCLCALTAAVAMATPKLRLDSAAKGPIHVNTGQNGPIQQVLAINAGDGSLSLRATSNTTWLAATVAGQQTCAVAIGVTSPCNPVNINLNTASLAKGRYTGLLTLSDPNAIDSPQTVTVTVEVGSSVPDSIDLYLSPNGSAGASFDTGSNVIAAATSPASGPSLSVVASGGGSFAFNFSYQVKAQAPAGTPESDYSGNIRVSGSSITTDNKTVPVTLHVTTQPIAAASSANLLFRIAQNAIKGTQFVAIANSGQGTLAVGAVTFTGSSGTPTWITTTTQGNLISFTADPAGLSPGVYTATASIASNAKNGAQTIPIELDVLATGPPLTYYQRVVDNALFQSGDPVAQGGWVAAFGEQFTTGAAALASSAPYPKTLGGASVFVNGQPAPVYYVSAGQINFLIPFGTPPGSATVRIDRDGQTGNNVSVAVLPAAPRIIRLGVADYGAVILGDGSFAIPPTAGIASRRAVAGVDSVAVYAFGLGQTVPPQNDGAVAPSAEPLARVPSPKVVFGNSSIFLNSGVTADPLFAGLAPGFVGLYQVNVTIPAASPLGDAVPVSITMNGAASNYVNIAVKAP